jgi:hypothetical protein
VDALEQHSPDRATRWLWIIQEPGQTEDQARTAYELEHRPIGEDSCIIWRVIETPSPA